MSNLLKFRTFRKNFIYNCGLLVLISVLSYVQKYIPYTIGEIVKQDIVIFVLLFIECFIIDVVKEKKKK